MNKLLHIVYLKCNNCFCYLLGNYKVLINTTKDSFDEYGFLAHPAVQFEHHNYKQLETYLKTFNDSYPNITDLKSIGKSVQGRDLYVFILGSSPLKHVSGKYLQ